MDKNARMRSSIKLTSNQTKYGASQHITHMSTIKNNTLPTAQNNTSILFNTKNTNLTTDSSAVPGSNRTLKTTVPTTSATSTPSTGGRTRTIRTRRPSIKITHKVSGGDKKKTTEWKTTLTTTELPFNLSTDTTRNNISAPFPTKSFNGIDHKGTAGHSQDDGLIGGIDQNYVIVGSVLGGLLLIVIIAALILCTRKHRSRLFKRRHSGSMDITGPCGLPDSPSSPTVNVSERMELIRPNSAGGVVCFNNNGAVSYHKDEVYLTIWDVNKNEEQPQQHQQQNEAEDHIDPNVKSDISQSVSPPTSRPQSSQQNLYSNHSFDPDESPTKEEVSSIGSPRENHSRPSSGQNIYANYTFDHTSPGNDNRSSDNPLLERKASDGDPEQNVYVNYSESQKELHERFGQDNDVFEGEVKGSAKLSTDKDQDVTEGNFIDKTGIQSEDADVSTDSNKNLGHTPTAPEHFYECEDSEPDTEDHRPSQLSRDSGIDADQDIDSYYDVPTAALDRLRRGQIKKSDNKSDGSSPNAKYQNPELKIPLSDYYMSPSSDNECEISKESDYENTNKNRPETYLCPDNLDLTSPTDEDELLKIYDNFELQARKLSTPNSCHYETPGELDQIYDMPASVKASAPCPQSQPASFEKFLSSSMPASIDIRKNKSDTFKKSISHESTNPELGHHPELETPKISNSSIEPPQANYVNTPETNNIYSVASDTQDPETEEAEYDTPKEICQSPFFQNIDQNKIKLGTRSLPPASKPPPPRLNRPKPLKIQNQREQSNALSPKSSEAHSYSQTLPRVDVENKPRTTPKNFKSLTLDNLSRKDNPQRTGSGRKKAVLPIDKASALIGISQKIPEDDEFSGVYSTPRSSVKKAKALPGKQGGKTSETARDPKDITGKSQGGYRNENEQKLGTHEILSKTPKKSFTGSSNSLDKTGKLDMGELQSAMKKKGLNN